MLLHLPICQYGFLIILVIFACFGCCSKTASKNISNAQDPTLDLRAVLQGAPLCHPAHRHALLHLRHHRHAGYPHFQLVASLVPWCQSQRCLVASILTRTQSTTDTTTSKLSLPDSPFSFGESESEPRVFSLSSATEETDGHGLLLNPSLVFWPHDCHVHIFPEVHHI